VVYWLGIFHKSFLEKGLNTLNYKIELGDDIKISLLSIFIIVFMFALTKQVLKIFTKLISSRLTTENNLKFRSLFSFLKYLIYAIVGVMAFHQLGISFTPLLAASTALLVGVGLAL